MLISLMDLMYICFLFPQGVNLDTLTDEEKFPEKNNFNSVKYNNLNLETNVWSETEPSCVTCYCVRNDNSNRECTKQYAEYTYH